LDWEPDNPGKALFAFVGFDKGDEVTGRGWAEVTEKKLSGQIKFHEGEKSRFVAKSWARLRKGF